MIKQTAPYDRWPSGDSWTVALIGLSVEQLQERGLTFERGEDDLDSFCLAAISVRRVGQLWLFRRDNSPAAGVELIVDSGVARDDALEALKRKPGLNPLPISWVNPLAAVPAPSLT